MYYKYPLYFTVLFMVCHLTFENEADAICFVISGMAISCLMFLEEKSLRHWTYAVIANIKIVKKHNEYFHLQSQDYEGEQNTIEPKLFR